jgi:hypothetical protein
MSLEVTLLWYLFLFAVCFILEKLTKCFSQMNLFTVFIYSFLIKHGVSVPYNLTINEEQIGLTLSSEVINRWIVSLVLMYICFILGILIARPLFGRRQLAESRLRQECMRFSQSGLAGVRKFFPLFAIGIAGFTFFLLFSPTLIIQALFSDDSSSATYKSARIAYGENFSSSASIFLRVANTFKLSVLPLCNYIMFFVQWRDKKYRWVFWGIFLATFLINLSSGQKAAVLEPFVGLLICYIFASGKLKISPASKTGKILTGVVLLLLLVIVPLQYQLQYPALSYQEALESVINRLGAETSRVLQLHFHVYPDIFPHLLGASSSLFGRLMGEAQILDPAKVIRGHIVFNDITDSTGYWNAAFIGAAWADFSYVGVVVQSILVSMMLWFYHQWFIKRPKTSGVMGTYVALVLASAYLSETNFFTTLLTCGLGLNFLLCVFLVSSRSLKPRSRHMIKCQ